MDATMTDYVPKKGELVLLEARIKDTHAPTITDQTEYTVEVRGLLDWMPFGERGYEWRVVPIPHPGVPIADLIAERDALMEEVGDLWRVVRSFPPDRGLASSMYYNINRARALRKAREKAAESKFKKDDDVWVRGEQAASGLVSIRKRPGVDMGDPRFCLRIHPDDIRPADD